jgi:hypothetical protein
VAEFASDAISRDGIIEAMVGYSTLPGQDTTSPAPEVISG